jgi:3-oxoacyl-[acyl-carrier-protein] synthase-3
MAREAPCRVAGTGTAFPRLPDGRGPLDNVDVVTRYSPEGRRGPRSADEIAEVARTLGESLGVEARYWAHEIGAPFAEGEDTSVDLAARALAAALEDAALEASALGAILTATSTPARITGANAPQVAARLGVRAMSFDIRSGCSGGLLALVQGCALASMTGKPIGVAASDTFSKLAPPNEPLAPLAFGDAGAAVILTPSDEGGALLSAVFDADGTLGHLGAAPAPFPVTHERLDEGLYFLSGDPDELARRSPALYADVITRALGERGLSPADVDLFVPHQTSRPAIESAAKAAGIALERTMMTAPRHGNCGAPGVLIALDAARREGRFGAGTLALFAALGGGLAWGAAVVRG